VSLDIPTLRTVCIRPVMPPKPAAKVLSPKLSIFAEAKQVRARFNAKWGRYTGSPDNGGDPNESRHRQSIAEREALAAKALALITARPRSSAEMREHFGMSENKMRAALGMLRSQGKVRVERRGGGTMWDAVK
jgi:hypothetical protein